MYILLRLEKQRQKPRSVLKNSNNVLYYIVLWCSCNNLPLASNDTDTNNRKNCILHARAHIHNIYIYIHTIICVIL